MPKPPLATSVRKATILHVLNLVLNKHSFRFSDSANSKRAIYAKMFPDSAATSINCGKTNAMYLAVHGLAPYAKRKLVLDASNKLFTVHVDETSYNKKNRLKFWIGFIEVWETGVILQIIRNWGTGWTVVISDWSEWRPTY